MELQSQGEDWIGSRREACRVSSAAFDSMLVSAGGLDVDAGGLEVLAWYGRPIAAHISNR